MSGIRTLVSDTGDNVVGIWTLTPSGSCTGCHFSTSTINRLHLDGTPTNSFDSIVFNSPPVITTPVSSSYLLLCPTNQSGCSVQLSTPTNPHPGGFRFGTTSPEFTVIQQWIADGHPF